MSTESTTTESTIATQGARPPLLRSTQLSAKLAALRLHHLLVESGKGICLSIIVCLELLALLMFVDWWVDFPWGLRLALLLGQFALFNALLYHYAFRHLLRPPSDEDLALRVERSHPELHSRLISSVQFSRADALPRGASVSFAESTIGQTESLTASMDFRRIVPTDSLRNLGLIAFAVLLLMLGSFYASRAVSWDLLRRAFLSQVAVPRKTRIAAITGNFTAGRGDTVRIEATAVGIIPATGQLLMSAKDQRNQEFPMEVSSDNSGRFSRSLDKVQEDFSYQVRLNDSLSPVYQVRVIPRPTVNELECEYHPPAYTGLRSARRAPGDLALLAGSKLAFKAEATKDLRVAHLRLLGPDTRQPLNITANAPRALSGEISVPTRGLTGFSFELEDTEGMTSPDGSVYRIDILPDRIPQARITWPERKEELITRQATLVVGFEASDDFRLKRLTLRYRASTLDEGAEKSIDLAIDSETGARVKRRYEWRMSSFQPPLKEGTMIEYWIEAEDNNDVTGPGIGLSDRQIARVVSESEKRADLLNRAGDSIGVLGDITTDQEKLNRSLGTLILERTGSQ